MGSGRETEFIWSGLTYERSPLNGVKIAKFATSLAIFSYTSPFLAIRALFSALPRGLK